MKLYAVLPVSSVILLVSLGKKKSNDKIIQKFFKNLEN